MFKRIYGDVTNRNQMQIDSRLSHLEQQNRQTMEAFYQIKEQVT